MGNFGRWMGFEQKILVDGRVDRQNPKSNICICPNPKYPPGPGVGYLGKNVGPGEGIW